MFIDFGEDVPEARDASGKKITPPDQGTAVSVGTFQDGWSLVHIPGCLEETWVHNIVLKTTKPLVPAPVLGPTREYTFLYESTNFEGET